VPGMDRSPKHILQRILSKEVVTLKILIKNRKNRKIHITLSLAERYQYSMDLLPSI
jgi:hypothetical protein